MNNMQLLTIIITILVPNMGIWFYLMKHSKELGALEGALFRELKIANKNSSNNVKEKIEKVMERKE